MPHKVVAATSRTEGKFLTHLTFGDILATPLLYTDNSSFGAGIINHTRRGPAQEKGTAGQVGGIPLAVSCFNPII
jgi:hypothetical protein